MKRSLLCLIFMVGSASSSLCSQSEEGREGRSLWGTTAPEWTNQQWINSEPLSLSQLRGQVVLLRFFMESACPMCRATAPSLNQLYSRYRDKGLVVVGMYTPKPRPARTPVDRVRQYVKDYQFEFPVALDDDWRTLRAFWLDRSANPAYTSVSFLIDKKGVVRFIHPGGQFGADSHNEAARRDFREIVQMIEKLLSE